MKKSKAKIPPKRETWQIALIHWWHKHSFKERIRGGMTPDEAKAAIIYEATRRRGEVQQAWVNGQFLIGDNGWQSFTAFVVRNVPVPWINLDNITKGSLVDAMHSPWFVPPVGYSTFPDTSSFEKCEKAAMRVLRLPATNDPAAAQEFVERARRFEDAGFIFAAIDNKTDQGWSYALRALKRALPDMPRSFRKADVQEVMVHRLPKDISKADKDTLESKRVSGTLTAQDLDNVLAKYRQPNTNQCKEWEEVSYGFEANTGKRKRANKDIAEKRFDFLKLCSEIEDLDNGKISQSDFVKRVRL